jgi:hypothetical protein
MRKKKKRPSAFVKTASSELPSIHTQMDSMRKLSQHHYTKNRSAGSRKISGVRK